MIGANREDRAAAVRERLAGAPHVEDTATASWPFERQVIPRGPIGAPVIWIRDLHLAFVSGQTAGTRLVLTQSTYQLQRWLDWLETARGVRVIADGHRGALTHSSPEMISRRGPWLRITVDEIESQAAADEITPAGDLHGAFRQPDPQRRLEICRRAIESDDAPARLLAFASACMELQLLDDAEAALERTAAGAADWEAVHYEFGKLWLRRDDTARAAAAFAEAARLMPTFAAAWSNLGAALGELDRPDEALEALTRALELDPQGHPTLNNIGAVHREQGRLEDAAAAFARVIDLAPGFVFGYYNLGHTRFLQGMFAEARRAYEEGFARDPQKNPRQGCRLAVARAAQGEAEGAIALFEELIRALPRERIQEGIEEAESTLGALSEIPGVDGAAIARVLAAVQRYSS